MNNFKESIEFHHYSLLNSTNQKLYQLAEKGVKEWTVVYCDEQDSGKGYSGNVWQTKPYTNATFSFLLKDAFILDKDLPFLNMWVASTIVDFLSKWQISAKVKWPNDIIVNNKKLAGILIENKIQGTKTKFTIIGIGLNILQTEFYKLPKATSLKKEYPKLDIKVEDFIKDLMYYFHLKYDLIQNQKYSQIIEEYNNLLFKKEEVIAYNFNEKVYNGIMKRVNEEGNAEIELEELGLKIFRHKEITMLY